MVGRFTDLLAIDGLLHLATDIDDYAAQMRDACAGEPRLAAVPPPWRPATRYEGKGEEAGRTATDLAYRRQS
jgi:tRNA (guanine-N7-)-methyltransferase